MAKAEELFTLIKPKVEEAGFQCKDVTFEKNGKVWVLTVYIKSDGNISLDDCETVSRLLSPYLDEIDPIEPSYILEVSSPGIDFPLKTDEDFQENLNNIVDIKLYKKIEGKKDYQGNLLDFDNESVTVEIDGKSKTFIRKDISKISPAVIF